MLFNDEFPVIIFLKGKDDTVSIKSDKGVIDIKGAWGSVGLIKNVHIKYNNTTDQLFLIRFHGDAFYRLFDEHAKYFRANPIFPLADICDKINFDIDSFFKQKSIPEKIAFIESHIGSIILDTRGNQKLNKLISALKNKDNKSIIDVAKKMGVNYKWMERNFMKNIGFLPKEFTQLYRFINAYIELTNSKKVDLMQIAISNGYYDSNHFLKEFKVYTGKSPIEYLKTIVSLGNES